MPLNLTLTKLFHTFTSQDFPQTRTNLQLSSTTLLYIHTDWIKKEKRKHEGNQDDGKKKRIGN